MVEAPSLWYAQKAALGWWLIEQACSIQPVNAAWLRLARPQVALHWGGEPGASR